MHAIPLILLLIAVALIVLHLAVKSTRTWVWKVLLAQGVLMLLSAFALGLFWAPPEREMGDVYRIIYAHVPQVWMALLGVTLSFGCSVAYMLKKSWVTDSLAEASAEVGVYFGIVGVTLGSIWAK